MRLKRKKKEEKSSTENRNKRRKKGTIYFSFFLLFNFKHGIMKGEAKLFVNNESAKNKFYPYVCFLYKIFNSVIGMFKNK